MSDISTQTPTGSEPTLGTAVDPAVTVSPAVSDLKGEPVSKPGSAAHRIETEFLRFKEISTLDADQFDCSPSNVSQVISKMEGLGYQFTRRTEGKFTYYRLSYVPTPDEVVQKKATAKVAAKPRKPGKRATKSNAAPAARAQEPERLVLPEINGNLRVSLIQADAKGNIKLGLTDEKRTWLVSVSALVPA